METQNRVRQMQARLRQEEQQTQARLKVTCWRSGQAGRLRGIGRGAAGRGSNACFTATGSRCRTQAECNWLLHSALPLTVQDLLHEVDAARVTAWDAGTRRAALAHEAGMAEEHAAVAKRRIPELEADKKAAAAARVSLPSLHGNHVHAAQGAVVGCCSRQ